VLQLRALLARGDIDAAVQIYEETGGAARDGLLNEVESASFELKKAIAMMLKKARDFGAAAHAWKAAHVDAEAAPCFEQAQDFESAARSWQRVGELLRAAAAFERAGQLDEALALYEKAGAKEAYADALARGRRYEDAAEAYRALGNLHGEVESLRACLAATPGAVPAALRLAELLANHGQVQKAAELLMDVTRRSPEAGRHRTLLAALAQLLDTVGNTAGAEKVRAHLARLKDPTTAQSPPVLEGLAAPRPSAATAPAGDAYGFLKALPMFAELSLEDMRSLFRACAQQVFPAGANLIEAGQPGRGLFLITDGQVEVYAGNTPDARLLNTLGVGGYVGEISLLLAGPTSARATARTPVKALFISREAFAQYLYSTPTAALCIYRLFSLNLAERVRTLSAAR
jgi:tetratricopeptide (TPR) repeat protein